MTVQDTPNPNARRFVVDVPVQREQRGRSFTDADAAADDPVASRLLALDGVTGILLLPASVTVTKANDADWGTVEPAVRSALAEALSA